MGFRHQLFVIARINSRYRCLAAIHNQFHSGVHTLQRCLALLKIYQAEANRSAIQQELALAERCGLDFWHFEYQSNGTSSPDSYGRAVAPFLFITTCLVLGTSFDAANGYQARVHPLNHNMKVTSGDNNDGITVLDITSLQEVRYCFANFKERTAGGEDGSESDDDVTNAIMIPANVPLHASSYLLGYETIQDTEAQPLCKTLIQELEGYHLIDAYILRDAWPDAGRHEVSNEPNGEGMQSPSPQSGHSQPLPLPDLPAGMDLLRRPFQREPLVFSSEHRKYVEDLAAYPDSDASLGKVVGAVWICIDGRSDNIKRPADGSIEWEKIAEHSRRMGMAGRLEHTMWPTGLEFQYGIFPLHDVPLSPTQIFNGVINFRTCMIGPQFAHIFDTSYIGLTFAKAFATACSKVHTTRNEIGPLPGALYAASSLSACFVNVPWPLDMPKLIPGQWAIVVIHEFDY